MSPNVRSILSGDAAAVEALVSKYHRWLREAAILMLRKKRFPNAEDEANEILQEIYTAILIKGINNVHTLEGYLLGMVRNKVVDRIRRPRRFYVELDESMVDGGVNVEQEVETRDLFERTFSQMSAKDQQRLQESIAGKSAKISLEIPVSTPRAIKSRVFKKFREIFAKVTKGPQS